MKRPLLKLGQGIGILGFLVKQGEAGQPGALALTLVLAVPCGGAGLCRIYKSHCTRLGSCSSSGTQGLQLKAQGYEVEEEAGQEVAEGTTALVLWPALLPEWWGALDFFFLLTFWT